MISIQPGVNRKKSRASKRRANGVEKDLRKLGVGTKARNGIL
jgi:hypothetical protein